jgi:5-methyltetrahydrofolate--homocysteine methyltransferase
MLDRCCISVTAPRTVPLPTDIELRSPRDLVDQWTNGELAYDFFRFTFSHGYFAGDALPIMTPYMGAGVVAAFLGSDYTFQYDTVWFGKEPLIREWTSRQRISLKEDHELWKSVQSLTQYYAENSPEKYLIGMTDLGGSFDIAVSLRGSQDLIYDLLDCPEEVMKLIDEIDEAWFACFNRIYSIISKYSTGMTNWIPLYYEGKWYPLQCDFSANLSPRIFDRYVKPSLEKEAAFLDKALYHLDGPDALKYIDSILDIDRINGIQWAPGDTGVPESSLAHDKWFPLYDKIQKKGKCLVLLNVHPRDIEKILSRVSAKGLFITTRSDSQDEADELLKNVERWSR